MNIEKGFIEFYLDGYDKLVKFNEENNPEWEKIPNGIKIGGK